MLAVVGYRNWLADANSAVLTPVLDGLRDVITECEPFGVWGALTRCTPPRPTLALALRRIMTSSWCDRVCKTDTGMP